MLTFNLKKEWYEKIIAGEKRVEYRRVSPYWAARLDPLKSSQVRFQLGYGGPTADAIVEHIEIGPCPYPGWEGDYYQVHFHLFSDYPIPRDPTIYYPGEGVDDLNIDSYLDFKEELEDLDDDSSDDFDDDDFESGDYFGD